MKRYLAILALGLLVFTAACTDPPDEDEKGTVIGSTSVEIDTRVITTHVGEAAIGSYMSDILKDALAAHGNTVDFAMLNAGAIRGGEWDTENFKPLSDTAAMGSIYPKGDLTDVEVKGWLPFKNDTMVATVSGEQLKSILERGVSAMPPDLVQEQGGWLLQTSAGLAYTITCVNQRQELNDEGTAIETAGERITKIEVGGTVIWDVDNSVDQLAGFSTVMAVNSFIGGGFDGHVAFNDATDKTNIPIGDLDHLDKVIADIKENSPIAPAKADRITVIGACGVPATIP